MEAKGGDVNIQILVGDMYYSDYGVLKVSQKVSFFVFLCDLNQSFLNQLSLDYGLLVWWLFLELSCD